MRASAVGRIALRAVASSSMEEQVPWHPSEAAKQFIKELASAPTLAALNSLLLRYQDVKLFNSAPVSAARQVPGAVTIEFQRERKVLRLYTLAFAALPSKILAYQPLEATVVANSINSEARRLLFQHHFNALLFCKRQHIGSHRYIDRVHCLAGNPILDWLNESDSDEDTEEEEEEEDEEMGEAIQLRVPEARPSILERRVFWPEAKVAYEQYVIDSMRPGKITGTAPNDTRYWAEVSFSFSMLFNLNEPDQQLLTMTTSPDFPPLAYPFRRFSSWVLNYQVYQTCNGAHCQQCVGLIRGMFKNIVSFVETVYARHLSTIHNLHESSKRAVADGQPAISPRMLETLAYFLFYKDEEFDINEDDNDRLFGSIIIKNPSADSGSKYLLLRMFPSGQEQHE